METLGGGGGGGGAVYIHWGRTSCPTNQGTDLVYSGRARGSRYYQNGGAETAMTVCAWQLDGRESC